MFRFLIISRFERTKANWERKERVGISRVYEVHIYSSYVNPSKSSRIFVRIIISSQWIPPDFDYFLMFGNTYVSRNLRGVFISTCIANFWRYKIKNDTHVKQIILLVTEANYIESNLSFE